MTRLQPLKAQKLKQVQASSINVYLPDTDVMSVFFIGKIIEHVIFKF